ncbi:MAG: alpha/beta hydrolase fold domain-containing protein [Burkholderiaceae bacterium]
MASWQAVVARYIIRKRVRPALGDMRDLMRVRKVMGQALPPPKGVRYTPGTLGGVGGEWVEQEGAADLGATLRPTLMYVHGGGFVGCSPRTHRPITAAFALQGLRVFAPDYRLAPEHPFPAPLDDVLAAWRALRVQHDADSPGQRLLVAGESAGGNLALALMLSLRDAGERQPAAAALFSPATDLSGGSPSIEGNAERDPMFHGPSLEHLGNAYLGATGDATNPLISPLFGDLQGLPPLLIHVAAEEALRDDGLRFAQKARAAGVLVETTVWPVVPHAWQLLAKVPEARQSIARASEFLKTAQPEAVEHLDTVIIGAGLSGIGAAVHLQTDFPGRRFTILESRAAMGGTWDLFRYPGVRSDSDMFTLGYAFKPWTDAKSLADGPAIRRYIVETAVEHGLDHQVRHGHQVVRADWSSADARWTLEIEHAADPSGNVRRSRLSCKFLLACSGYYSYAAGHTPEFAGAAGFAGRIVHPQFWPADLDYAGKRVVVIGSGATAVTLVPEMARTAAHVTMLQRSPTYVLSLPARDAIADALRRRLPRMLAYRLTRTKNIGVAMLFFKLARRWPARIKKNLIGMVRQALGPGHDVDTHFTPRYDPWDQRVCFVPDGDLFEAIKSGQAEVVTDHIDTFTAGGIRLQSGRELPADIVVSATGLTLNLLGDVAFAVDGQAVDFSKTLGYKGMMFSGVPNFIYTFGYTNASWTLKADLTAGYASRLLAYMDKHGIASATPVSAPDLETRPFLDFSSGYVQRAMDFMPRQGVKAPWRLYQNYLLDMITLRWSRIADGRLKFGRVAQELSGPRRPGPG